VILREETGRGQIWHRSARQSSSSSHVLFVRPVADSRSDILNHMEQLPSESLTGPFRIDAGRYSINFPLPQTTMFLIKDEMTGLDIYSGRLLVSDSIFQIVVQVMRNGSEGIGWDSVLPNARKDLKLMHAPNNTHPLYHSEWSENAEYFEGIKPSQFALVLHSGETMILIDFNVVGPIERQDNFLSILKSTMCIEFRAVS
jgi:hypothetical protein